MFWKFVCSSCTGCRQAVSSMQPGRRSWRHVHWTWCVDAVRRINLLYSCASFTFISGSKIQLNQQVFKTICWLFHYLGPPCTWLGLAVWSQTTRFLHGHGWRQRHVGKKSDDTTPERLARRIHSFIHWTISSEHLPHVGATAMRLVLRLTDPAYNHSLGRDAMHPL